jgi:transposase
VIGDGSATSVLLGLDGFVLLAVDDHDGEVTMAVETTEKRAACQVCGVFARLHGRRPTWMRDLPSAGRPVILVWVKRVWRCAEPACSASTWTETSAAIRARSGWTERARAEACRRVGADGASVAQVARDFGVSWDTAMAAVREYGTPLVEDPARLAGVRAAGVDETAFLAANARHSTEFVTGIVDLHRRRLLDVVPGRSGKALQDWASAQPQQWREGVQTAAFDPFRGYATALAKSLPHAVRVLDAFHVTKLGFTMLDDVRRRVQQESTRHRGRKHDPLYRIRRVSRRAAERLNDRAWQRLLDGLEAGDPNGEVADAWIAAQDLRLIYHATDKADAADRLYRWRVAAAESTIPELHRLARTLDGWTRELLAYFDTDGISNGPTEAMNLLIKKIKRIGHGFRNFNNYRLRLLLHCGGVTWHTPVPTPLRGRLPRLAA